MITDEQLDERADELTTLFDMAGYVTFTTNPLRIYWNLKREALGRDRESYSVITKMIRAMKKYEMDVDGDSSFEHRKMMKRAAEHIVVLKQRLGIQ